MHTYIRKTYHDMVHLASWLYEYNTGYSPANHAKHIRILAKYIIHLVYYI